MNNEHKTWSQHLRKYFAFSMAKTMNAYSITGGNLHLFRKFMVFIVLLLLFNLQKKTHLKEKWKLWHFFSLQFQILPYLFMFGIEAANMLSFFTTIFFLRSLRYDLAKNKGLAYNNKHMYF